MVKNLRKIVYMLSTLMSLSGAEFHVEASESVQDEADLTSLQTWLKEHGIASDDLLKIEGIHLPIARVQALPKDIGDLTYLESLIMPANDLEQVPDSIKRLIKLKELNLAENRVKNLPDTIGELINLEIFDMSGNPLKSLPDSIGELKKLRQLSLPESIGNQQALRQLYNLAALCLYDEKGRRAGNYCGQWQIQSYLARLRGEFLTRDAFNLELCEAYQSGLSTPSPFSFAKAEAIKTLFLDHGEGLRPF